MPQPKIYASHAHRQAAYHQRREEARRLQLQERGLPALPAIPTMPGAARWNQSIASAMGMLSTVAQEMQSYFDGRSEEWQEGDRGQAFQERLDAIGAAKDEVAELTDA